MNTDAYLDAIASYGQRFIDVVRTVDPDTPVPTCPGWTVRDLTAHLAVVYGHKAETVRGGWVTEGPPRPAAPEADEVAAFGESLDEILRVFTTADLSRPTHTWCHHDGHLGEWWVRRIAHETAVHHADAVIAVGSDATIGAQLAQDGVDEFLDELVFAHPPWGRVIPSDKRVDLVAGREWKLRTATFSGATPSDRPHTVQTLTRDEVGDADGTITTDPGTLDLWLWGRVELPDRSVTGSEAVVDQVRAVSSAATS